MKPVAARLQRQHSSDTITSARYLQCDDYHIVTEPLHYVMESYNAVWDSSDIKFDPGLQASYDLRYGPFEVDAC